MHWSQKEVEKAAKIVARAEKKKSGSLRLLDETVHWLLLLVVLLGNLILAGFLVLVSDILDAFFLTTVLILGLAFGWLVEMPLRDLEKLDKHKHFLSRVLLPLLALVNVYLIIGLKRMAEISLGKTLEFNALLAGIVYGVAFLMPHLWYHLKKRVQ
ncbi:hypothetical protein J4419_02825 [Candidatus Woesearchaeota archaeon]|nr:hypothetical protein [Candidatus Woesearchaeota archaeon]